MPNSLKRVDSANEVVCQDYTEDTPVTLGMLLAIARRAHQCRHTPDAPPTLALAYVEAIEDLIPNPWRGG